MTLYDLVNATTIQGEFIEIRVYEEDGTDEVKSQDYQYVDDLAYEDIDEYEDMEIRFIYSSAFVRYYPHGTRNCSELIIELEKEA